MKLEALNSHNLKTQLWDTLNALQDKKIDPKTANSIATQSREIMRIVKTELEISRSFGKRNSVSARLTAFAGK